MEETIILGRINKVVHCGPTDLRRYAALVDSAQISRGDNAQWHNIEGHIAVQRPVNSHRIDHRPARFGQHLYLVGICAVFRIRQGDMINGKSIQPTQHPIHNCETGALIHDGLVPKAEIDHLRAARGP